MTEVWKSIKGFPLYEVSNLGNVRHIRKTKNLTPTLNGGYLAVKLYGESIKTCKVHRLVAEAFLENPEELLEVNHKDVDKHNNNVNNLEWVSRLGNMRHAYEKEVVPILRGELNGMSKLTNEQVQEIRNKYQPRVYSCRKLGAEYGVSATKICQIINNKAWSHV